MNVVALIGAIILGLLCSIFPVMLIWSAQSWSKLKKSLWSIFCIVFICSCLYIGLTDEQKQFNNGKCINCDIKYNAIEHKKGSTYYECPNCYFGTWY